MKTGHVAALVLILGMAVGGTQLNSNFDTSVKDKHPSFVETKPRVEIIQALISTVTSWFGSSQVITVKTAETQRVRKQLEGVNCDGNIRPVSPGYVQISGEPEIMFSCTEKSRPVGGILPEQPFETTTIAPLTTTTPSISTTTTTNDDMDLSTAGNNQGPTTPKVDDAICQINVYPVDSISNGNCAGGERTDVVRLDASVGGIQQQCTQHTTTASSSQSETILYMTIQPLCKQTTGPQHWSVCSWQPDATSSLCTQFDQQCCDRIVPYIDSFIPSDIDRSLLACQEYISVTDVAGGEDDGTSTCQIVYGWNGTHPQTYAFELLQCSGGVPSDPDCQKSSSPLLEGQSSPKSSGADATLVVAALGIGCGLLLVGVALRLRRHRAAQDTARGHKKHQFVDWMEQSTAAIPDDFDFSSKPKTKRHRDFVRLYENLDADTPGTRTTMTAPATTQTLSSHQPLHHNHQQKLQESKPRHHLQTKTPNPPLEKSALLSSV
eukprot:m.29287 g.29287  ORF g.29287 m.29287 type:complete len:493 (+) comp16071_c0_seq1:250-1728(+)